MKNKEKLNFSPLNKREDEKNNISYYKEYYKKSLNKNVNANYDKINLNENDNYNEGK